MAAFITPKLPVTQVEAEVKKPLGDVQNKTDVKKPPLAQPESETDFEKFVFESLHQTVESGGVVSGGGGVKARHNQKVSPRVSTKGRVIQSTHRD